MSNDAPPAQEEPGQGRPELRFWKDRAQRIVNAVEKMRAKVDEWEDPLDFPVERKKLHSFVRTRLNSLKALRIHLENLESKLEAQMDMGKSIVASIKDVKVRTSAQEELDLISGLVLSSLDSFLGYAEVIGIRQVELEEQAALLLGTANPGNRSANAGDRDVPLDAQEMPRRIDGRVSQDRPTTQPLDTADGASDDDDIKSVSTMSHGGIPRHRPKQQLPRFKGDVRKYPSFWAAYSAMIHNAEDLTDLDKFFYLRQSLRDEALRLVEEIPVTEDNYSKAISLLQHRYDLGSSVTTVMIADLQKIKPAKENTRSIRETLELLRQKLITLECHGEQFHDKHIWKSLILSKFPASVNSHVIKEERRLLLGKAGIPGSFPVMDLLEKIADYVLLLECIDLNVNSSEALDGPGDKRKDKEMDKKHSSDSSSRNKEFKKNKKKRFKCICQSTDHLPQSCDKFTTPSARRQEATRLEVCWKCFRTGHQSKECNRLGPCPECSGDHHSALCGKKNRKDGSGQGGQGGSEGDKSKQKSGKPKSGGNSTTVTSCTQDHSGSETEDAQQMVSLDNPLQLEASRTKGQIILTHVTGLLFNEKTKEFQQVNVFIDDGAVMSLIRNGTAESHLLEKKGPFKSLMSGVGGQIVDHSYNLATAKLRSTVFGEADRVLQLRTISEICQPLRTAALTPADWNLIRTKGIRVNRCTSERAKVDILIGQDYRKHFVYDEEPRIRLPSGLLLTKTIFGYAVSGCSTALPQEAVHICLPICNVEDGELIVGVHQEVMEPAKDSVVKDTVVEVPTLSLAIPVLDQELEEFKSDLRNLYGMECLGIRTENDQNEMKAISFMEDYRKSIEISNGQVVAGFPFLDTVNQLADNFTVAVKQLQHQIRSLAKEHLLLYEKTFEEYRSQGIIEEVPLSPGTGVATFYMPHHAVICPEKSTAFRVVFNGSSHARGELSLNDVIFPGYTLNALIFDVLLQFRAFDYAMTADIQKAFLQIRLPQDHRDVTRFLWIKCSDRPATGANLKVFRFTRVPFGINASPAILNQSILKHLEMINSATSKEIAQSIYVDNVLLGATSAVQLVEKYQESKELFRQIGMRLRDYLSCVSEVNEAIPEEDRAKTTVAKVLGIPWNALEDTLTLRLARKPAKKITMRAVLSQVNGSTYDPLGLMSPFLFHAKVFLQNLHKKKMKWNEELSTEDQEQWNRIVAALDGCTATFPRTVTQTPGVASRQLMVFSDSSERAYGCVAYVTTRTTSGRTYTRLLTAKMKMAPIKQLTIPRLELTGILTAANMANSILTSDSTIAIAWIKSKRLLPPFVKELVAKINRVYDRIKESASMDLHHVPTAENPADHVTRGLDNTATCDHVWFKGPAWLNKEKSNWPLRSLDPDVHTAAIPVLVATEAAEGKRVFDIDGGIWPVSRIGSYEKLQRVVGYGLRFVKHTRKGKTAISMCKEDHKDLRISGAEMINAERHLLLQEQQKIDMDLMKTVCRKMNLQFDRNGLLRKCSRLNNSSLTYDEANPLFVPSKSLLAQKIIWSLHNGNYHRKGSHLQSLVQRKFWIPGVRKLCERTSKICSVCAIYGRPYKYPDLTDLPAERVRRAEPFAFTGTDLFGPVMIKTAGGTEEKRWVALFTCFVTRLTHLEIVHDQSARAFLLALRRFCSRRGVPKKIWSDNGTNFKLTAKLIKDVNGDELQDEEVSAFVANHHIQWTFIPPGAPWMGGSWERMVGLVKKPLMQATGRRRLSEDLLHTLLCEIEAIINSRPLHFTSENSSAEVLRPVDFSTPRLRLCYPPAALADPEDPDFLPTPLAKSRAAAMKALEDLESNLDRFWKRFHMDYLRNLKGIFNKRSVDYAGANKIPQIGDIVLLDEDNGSPRHRWPKGRITGLNLGHDGAIRSATVTTPSGSCLCRPINKLVPLEMSLETEGDNEENAKEKDVAELEEPGAARRPLPRQAKKNVNYKENAGVVALHQPLKFNWFLPLILLATIATSSATTLPSTGVLECVKGGVLLSVDRQPQLNKPVTSEICVNSRSCTTIVVSSDQKFFVSPAFAIADYTVQWRALQGTSQFMEIIRCKGTPSCDLIDCWICAELIGNPHCWPQAAIFATIFWIYLAGTTIFLLWSCCCREKVKDYCRRKLESTGTSLQKFARRHCSTRRRHSDASLDSQEILPLTETPRDVERRHRLQPSRIITEFAIIITVSLLISSADACQRISVVDSTLKDCPEGSTGKDCDDIYTSAASLSELRRDLCIRSSKDNLIHQEVKLHLEEISLFCNPVTHYFTRNEELKTYSVLRCAIAGSCTNSFCDSISARTSIPELSEHDRLPGISRCSPGCGQLLCGCVVPEPGCLFSRTVADPVDEEVFEVFSCPTWYAKTRIRLEEIYANGTRMSRILSVQDQSTTTTPMVNITVNFVASPHLPLLSSLFLRTSPSGTLPAMGLLAAQNTEIALQCPSSDAAKKPTQCFLRNTCLCSPSISNANCDCHTFNISTALQSLDSRLPITTPDVALRLNANGLLTAISHHAVAEVSVVSRFAFNELASSTSRCTLSTSPVEGCFKCLIGSSATVNCTSDLPTIATLRCSTKDYAVTCNSTGVTTSLRFFSTVANFEESCAVSCSSKNITLHGVLLFPSLVIDNVPQEERGHYINFYNVPDINRVLQIAGSWWKTTLLAFILPVAAVGLAVLFFPYACQRCLYSKLKNS